MEDLGGVYRGDLVIRDREVTVRAMIGGDLIIEGASHVMLTGMVKGSVRLRTGAALIRGSVGGNVTNEGGSLSVSGMVTGAVKTFGGTTVIEQGAMIGRTSS